MAVTKHYEINLDIKRSTSNRPVEVVEGDNGNRITVTLTDGGLPVDLTGCLVVAVFSKSDGHTVEQDNDGHGIEMDPEEINAFTIDLYTTSFAPGLVECEIQVLSGEGRETLVTSAKFNFTCRRSLMNADTVAATEEHPILVGLIQAVTQLDGDVRAAETAREDAEAAREAIIAPWADVAATAETLPPGGSATVDMTVTAESVLFEFGLPRGQDGTGSGDMSKSTYDPNGDGVIAIAQGGTGAVTAAGARAALDAAATAKVKPKTLPAASWSNGAITISDGDILAASPGDVKLAQSADAEEFAAWAQAAPQVTGQAAGSVTVTARGVVPAVDIPVILEVRS